MVVSRCRQILQRILSIENYGISICKFLSPNKLTLLTFDLKIKSKLLTEHLLCLCYYFYSRLQSTNIMVDRLIEQKTEKSPIKR